MDNNEINILRNYKQLLDDGAITEEEFEKMKEELMFGVAPEAKPVEAETEHKAAEPNPWAIEALKRINALLENGTISREEYDSLKADIISGERGTAEPPQPVRQEEKIEDTYTNLDLQLSTRDTYDEPQQIIQEKAKTSNTALIVAIVIAALVVLVIAFFILNRFVFNKPVPIDDGTEYYDDYDEEYEEEEEYYEEDEEFVVGETYYVQDVLRVRERPSTDARQLKRSELADIDYVHSEDYEDALLKKGSPVVCLEVSGDWMRIESGWICTWDGEHILVE